jgi:hypothetical protein
MALVDYSESDSDSGSDPEANSGPNQTAASKPTPAGASTSKKPFQKIVDRANPGRIQVSLSAPTTTAATTDAPPASDEPPAKRARTTGGGRFSGFGSFLPPPKAAKRSGDGGDGGPQEAPRAAPAARVPGGKAVAQRPVVHLKTSAEAAFSRGDGGGFGGRGEEAGALGSTGLTLPPPRSQAQPSIPTDMKPAEEVKLVGKPLMFKPLSVARKPGQKEKKKKKDQQQHAPQLGNGVGKAGTTGGGAQTEEGKGQAEQETEAAPTKPKVSLFSFAGDTATKTEPTTDPAASLFLDDLYGPTFQSHGRPTTSHVETDGALDSYNAGKDDDGQHDQQQGQASVGAPSSQATLSTMADSLNLSATARRELFGRNGLGASSSAKVVSFDMEQEYAANQALRLSDEAQQAASYKPVRAIATGKHSLRQIVDAVQNQTGALEESFAANRSKKREAAGRYGWK